MTRMIILIHNTAPCMYVAAIRTSLMIAAKKDMDETIDNCSNRIRI